MKKVIGMGWALAGVFLMNSCLVSCDDDYDESELREDMKELADRVSQLERLCEEMNTNVSSLATIVKAVGERDCITSVSPVRKDSAEVGYTITFGKNKPITVYDGKDGVTPQLSVGMDRDSVYYWKLNGEWLLTEGAKIPVNGTDGTDGVTPAFEIRNGEWFISYDKGMSWIKVGQATGEPGDAMFKSVSHTATDVVFTLNDGTVLTIPLKQKDITSFTFIPEYEDNWVVMDNENHEKGLATLKFYVTPKEVVGKIQENWKEAVRAKGLYTKLSRATTPADMPVTRVEADAAEGILTVTISGENLTADFYKKSVGAQVLLEIQHNQQTLSSELINIDSNKVLGNMIKYRSQADLFPCIANNATWRDYNMAPYYRDSYNHWIIFDQDLEELPENAFSHREAREVMTAITLPWGLKRIGMNAFARNKNLTQVNVQEGLKAIDDNAFARCGKLSEINLPEGLDSIAPFAFAESGLKKVTLPNSLSYLSSDAFLYCQQLEAFHGKFASDDHCALVCEDTLIAFALAAPVDAWTVPATVKKINHEVFAGCQRLKTVTFPEGLQAIGEAAFYECTGLTAVSIPNSVTQLDDAVFHSCTALTSVQLPNGITKISNSLFMFCPLLAQVTIPDLVESIEESAFYGCGLTTITIPEKVTTIGNSAFSKCRQLTEILLPANVQQIDDFAFAFCDGLTKATLSEGLTEIGEAAFYKCDKLKTVVCKAPTPPAGDDLGFVEDAVIYVPAASVEAYKANENWNSYTIRPIPENNETM